MPIFCDKDKKLYLKVFNSKEELNSYLGAHGALDSSSITLFSSSPLTDINYLCAFFHFDLDKLSIKWFPKDWNYKRIIEFLLSKINGNDLFVNWEDELLPDAKKYGLHDINDFNKPYI